MNDRRIFISLACACLAGTVFQGCRTPPPNEQTAPSVVNEVFPPLPAGLTNIPTIGPAVITVLPDVVTNLGGSDVTNMAVAPIAVMLDNSGRFIPTYSTNHDYDCWITLNQLRIEPVGHSSGQGAGGFWGSLASNCAAKIETLIPSKWRPTNSAPFRVDWTNTATTVNISCALSMQIIDSKSENLFAGANGGVNEGNTANNISMEIGGFTKNSDVTNEVTIKSSLIVMASYNALTNMLPELDRKILKRQKSFPAQRTEREP